MVYIIKMNKTLFILSLLLFLVSIVIMVTTYIGQKCVSKNGNSTENGFITYGGGISIAIMLLTSLIFMFYALNKNILNFGIDNPKTN